MNEEELRKKIGREEQMEKIDKYRILNTIAKNPFYRIFSDGAVPGRGAFGGCRN